MAGPLAPLLVEVTQEKVAGLLQQRRPEILETGIAEQLEMFEDRVRGAAVQVVLLTGPDPAAGPIRDLAVEIIALQTASEIEYAEFPEQQVAGDQGRGYHLHQRYLELLGELRAIIANTGSVGGVTTSSGLPRARFPQPSTYPDPVVVRGVTRPASRWVNP